jgi:hypothetical protein
VYFNPVDNLADYRRILHARTHWQICRICLVYRVDIGYCYSQYQRSYRLFEVGTTKEITISAKFLKSVFRMEYPTSRVAPVLDSVPEGKEASSRPLGLSPTGSRTGDKRINSGLPHPGSFTLSGLSSYILNLSS